MSSLLSDDEDSNMESVKWETVNSNDQPISHKPLPAPSTSYSDHVGSASVGASAGKAGEGGGLEGDGHPNKWDGWLDIIVRDPVKEMEGSKDAHVTFAIHTRTNLPTFAASTSKVRRRFQDFNFLKDSLTKDFPACVVPPLPDKHRLEYITGDRFSSEFLEKRVEDLQRFLVRITRHPTLRRAALVAAFLESTDWSIRMHKHLANPVSPDAPTGIIDTLSDSIVNLTSGRVRKPDPRFEEMRESMDHFEEGLIGVEKGGKRLSGRVGDLSADYQELAQSVQGLGYLESGITEPLNRFADRMLEFSSNLRYMSSAPLPPFLAQLHSLLLYSQAHRALLKLRDQKQLDSEILSEYLTTVVLERDRLAALNEGNATGVVGLGTYLRDRVDKVRGTDDIGTRRERMKKLEGKIAELQEAVTQAVETSTAFSEETLSERDSFELSKKEEMKELLSAFADGQIRMYENTMKDWDKLIPVLSKIRVDV